MILSEKKRCLKVLVRKIFWKLVNEVRKSRLKLENSIEDEIGSQLSRGNKKMEYFEELLNIGG